MVTHPSTQRELQGITFASSSPESQVCQGSRIFFSSKNGLQNMLSSLPHDSSEHRAQFQIRVFQGFMHPIDQPGPFPCQSRAQTGQITQLSLRPRRDKAGFEQSQLQELGDPLGILLVGFPGLGTRFICSALTIITVSKCPSIRFQGDFQ